MLLPGRIVRERGEQRQHHGLAVGVAVLEDLDDLVDQFRIGRGRRIKVQDAALPILVNVADRLPHLGARILRRVPARRG